MNTIGMLAADLETPALLVDIAAMERNEQRMAGFCSGVSVQLRPHVKSHRSPELARRQLASGAHGICCGSLAEAEAMLEAGVDDILITKQIVKPAQLARVAELARTSAIIVLADHDELVERLDRCALQAGTCIDVLIDVDIGLGRSGVAPMEAARRLAQRADRARGLRLLGLMGYEGSMHDLDAGAREAACAHALGRLVATRQLIERDGIELRIVSSGATSTFRTAGTIDGITEIQPGTYLLGDAKYRLAQPEFETALSVLTTVINLPSAGRITVDAGQKKLTSAAQLPQPKDSALRMLKVQEEHGLLEVVDGRNSPRIGDTLELIPWHGGTTVNLYDRIYGIRDGYIAEVWNVAARGSQ